MAENAFIKSKLKTGPRPRKFYERKHAVRVPFVGAIFKKFGLTDPNNEDDLAQAKIKLQNFLEEKLSEL